MDANKKLCIAIKNENLAEVNQAFEDKENPAHPHARVDYDEYFTAWNCAYSCDSTAIMASLIKNGANVNCPIPELDNETAIFGAILNRNENTIDLLVSEGADINAMDANGYTPLYSTVEQSEDCLSLVPFLLSHGANIMIGESKIPELKKKNEKKWELFCKHVIAFLEELEDKVDLDSLQEQTDRIMMLTKKHNHGWSQDLIEKTKELRGVYCLQNKNDDDPIIVIPENKSSEVKEEAKCDTKVSVNVEGQNESKESRGVYCPVNENDVDPNLVKSSKVREELKCDTKISVKAQSQNEFVDFGAKNVPRYIFDFFLKLIKQENYSVMEKKPEEDLKAKQQDFLKIILGAEIIHTLKTIEKCSAELQGLSRTASDSNKAVFDLDIKTILHDLQSVKTDIQKFEPICLPKEDINRPQHSLNLEELRTKTFSNYSEAGLSSPFFAKREISSSLPQKNKIIFNSSQTKIRSNSTPNETSEFRSRTSNMEIMAISYSKNTSGDPENRGLSFYEATPAC